MANRDPKKITKHLCPILAAALVLLGLFTAAFAAAHHLVDLKKQAQSIIIAGTGDSQNLLRIIAVEYQRLHPMAIISVPNSIGSGGGIKALLAKKCDLARIARPMKDREKKIGLTNLIFAKNPIVFVTNKAAGPLDTISLEQISAIYQGSITEWQALNPALNLGRLYPITREEGDSSLLVLRQHLPVFQQLPQKHVAMYYSTPKTLQVILDHQRTLGYLPMSEVVNTSLNILKIDNIYPSIDNVQSGRYKLSVPLGLVYKNRPEGITKDFIKFIFSPAGQRLITSNGAVPSK